MSAAAKKSFAEMLGEISATAQGGRRVADIVAALQPPPEYKQDTAIARADGPSSLSGRAVAIIPGVVGAGIGALAWPSHRVLGAVAGHAVITTGPAILRGGPGRRRALCQLGVEGAAIAGSLWWKGRPIAGFLAGLALGCVVTAFIDGSPTNELWKRFRSK